MLRQRALATLKQGVIPARPLTLLGARLSVGSLRSSALRTQNTVQARTLSTSLLPKRPQSKSHQNVHLHNSRVYATEASNAPPVKQRSRFVRALYKTFAFAGFTVITTGVLVIAFFLYDASTYKDEVEGYDIPIPEIALNPRRGGPKNLPIAEYLVDDGDSEEQARQMAKPKLVVLGCGWGSVALLKNINPDNYHVTVISSNNYFLYTPLLPSATVGTLELRSLIEPVRKIVARIKGHFLQAKADSVDFSAKLVEVSQTLPNGETRNFYLPYDKLVIAVGMFIHRP